MAKFCKNCGAPLEEGALFCANCGTKVEEAPKADAVFTEVPKAEEPQVQETPRWEEPKREEAPRYNYETDAKPAPACNTAGISSRNIVLCIVFLIITCGIYGFYWIYKLNEELKQLAEDDFQTSGGMVILFSVITCGIYGLYWYYKMGEKVEAIKCRNGKSGDNSKILYLVLAIFGLSVINCALMQDTINKEVA